MAAMQPLERMRTRVETDRSDSDTALFLSLMYYGELATKLIVASFTSLVDDDRDRHRYRQMHRLVRADGLGEWASALDEIFAGPASQFLAVAARPYRDELIQKH